MIKYTSIFYGLEGKDKESNLSVKFRLVCPFLVVFVRNVMLV